jgi:ABC-type Fe3+/spermidine/putrescine transport system ATPase subunit
MIDVSVRDLVKRYGEGVTAIQDVSAEFAAGKTTVIVGPSGSGKTTLLNLVAGLLRPDHGTIWFGGHDVTNVPPEARNIGYVFQTYALFPHMTAEENVAFGVARGDRESVTAILRMFRIEHLRRRRPGALSGGEKQRVAFARALARRPAILLLDEPLSALDAELRDRLRGELRSLFASLGTTTIYVTHDRSEAMLLGDTVAIMSGGRILQHDRPERIYRRPVSTAAARFFGDVNLIEGVLDDTRTHVHTPFGRFALAETCATGPHVVAVVRPEMFTVAPSHPDLTLHVERAGFLGSRWRVEGTAEGVGHLIVELRAEVAVAAGESVPLRIQRNSLHVIDAEESAHEILHEHVTL